MHDVTTSLRWTAVDYEQIFASVPAAMIAVDSAGVVLAYNATAAELFGPLLRRAGARCCDLAGCGRGSVQGPLAYHCVTVAALERDAPLRGLHVELEHGHAELSVGPLESGDGAVLIVRALNDGSSYAPSSPTLWIKTFGGLDVEGDGRPLSGEWLHHLPAQLLRYLICARRHHVPAEELVDALWPNGNRAGLTNLRQAVHVLRDRLEPDRQKNAPSAFVVATKGGYQLNMASVRVDADEFELEANAALLTLERSGEEAAVPQLARAAELYAGEFLADAPYADWALEERDRLRTLALRVLRALADVDLAAGRQAQAYSALLRIADLEPLNPGAQRDLIALMLQFGRHTEAARRFDAFARRFRRAFEEDPGFTLGQLAALNRGARL